MLDVWNFRDAALTTSHPFAWMEEPGGPLAILREVGAWGHEWPWPLFPEPGGFLPFASVAEINYLGWLISEDGENQEVVYLDCYEFEVHRLDGDTFGKALLRVLSNSYSDCGFPTFEKPIRFVSCSSES